MKTVRKKHKHLKTKIKIVNAILDKSQVECTTLSIDAEDFSHAFGFRDLEEMTEYCQPELMGR